MATSANGGAGVIAPVEMAWSLISSERLVPERTIQPRSRKQ